MKKLFFILVAVYPATTYSQTAKPKPAANAPLFKNMTDSASYAIGMSIAHFYKQQGVTRINSSLVLKAINDVLGGKAAQFDDNTANDLVNRYMNAAKAEKSKTTIEAGQKYLAANKTKPGVKTTASGLQYEVLQEGSGDKPTATSTVTCNYKGTLIDGTEFDNSYSRGKPSTFSLTRVIAGWTEGLQLMSPGAKFRFWVPYNLAYGLAERPKIPAGSALIFEVELISVEK